MYIWPSSSIIYIPFLRQNNNSTIMVDRARKNIYFKVLTSDVDLALPLRIQENWPAASNVRGEMQEYNHKLLRSQDQPTIDRTCTHLPHSRRPPVRCTPFRCLMPNHGITRELSKIFTVQNIFGLGKQIEKRKKKERISTIERCLEKSSIYSVRWMVRDCF